MKDIKKIREFYDLVTEAEDKDTRKLTALVRAGLFDAKKLPALKRALDKNADKMTPAEKRMLIGLLDSLMSEVLGSQSVYTKVKQNVQHEKLDEANRAIGGQGYLSKYDPRGEKGYPKQEDMPAVIVLKRKAIRVYPDNTKVALYYSQALDKYVSIPFGETGVSNMNEETASAGDDKPVNMPGKKKTKQKSPIEKGLEMRRFNKDYNRQGYVGKVGKLKGAGMGTIASMAVAAMPDFQSKRIQRTVQNARKRTDTFKESAITESFSQKLEESRKQQIDEMLPAIVAAARVAAPAIVRGGASLMSRIAPRVAGAASKALTRGGTAAAVADKAGKATRAGRLSKTLKRAAVGVGAAAAADSLTGGGDKEKSSSEGNFKKGEYNFSMKAKTSRANEFDPLTAKHKRDETSSRKMMNQPLNETPLSIIRKTVAENLPEAIVSFGDKQITINNNVANKINNLYEMMNKNNKKQMEKMINESASSFSKVLTFSVRY